jgi:selenide,water dikinase
MGGKPLSALQLVSWPRDDLSFEILSEVLNGGLEIMNQAGCTIIGGHSIDDKEPKYGFAVTGIIEENIYRKTNIQEGDILYLTKPLGSGIISSAIKKNIASKDAINEVTGLMTTLNDKGLQLASEMDANAITDVTGFGLLGHLIEMIGESDLSVNLFSNKIPVLKYAEQYLEQGIYPSGSKRNLEAVREHIQFNKDDESVVNLIADAQTSGGLVFSSPKNTSEYIDTLCQKIGIEVWEIGNIVSKYKNKVNIIKS